MIGFLAGAGVGWLVNVLSDVLAYRFKVPNAIMPNGLPLGGIYRQPRPRYAVLHFMMELLSAVFIGWIYLHYPLEQALMLGAIFAFLLLITLIDLKYQRIFNALVYPTFVVVAVVALATVGSKFGLHVVGAGLAFGIFQMASLTTKGGLGGGDIKLAGLLGMAFGIPNIFWVLLAGTGLGALVAIGLLVSKRSGRATRIPYAPFLCAGAWLVTLWIVH